MKALKKKIIVLSVLLAAFGFSCKKTDASATGAPAAGGGRPGGDAQQVFAVTTIPAVEQPLSSYLLLAGDIIASSTVDAYSDAAGKVTRVNVAVGSRVTRGQAIASIDPSKPGMRFVQHTVTAPISGTITSLTAEVGMTISQSTPLAKISGGGGLEIQLFVPERYISRVSLALPCEITLDAYPGEVFRGIVNEVSPTVDTVSRTEMIKVNVDNPGQRLKAGMFAKVRVITDRKEKTVQVPSSSIIQRQGKTVVFVTAPGTEDPAAAIVHQVEVVMGISSDGITEIISGVRAGDNVVDKGMTLLTDGARVNIINRAPQQQNGDDAGEQSQAGS